MSLDDKQRKTVADWLEQGLKLSEIQKKLDAEMGIRMTYMEVRFLLDDLRLKPKEEPKEPEPAPAEPAPAEPAPALTDEPAPAATGGVSVTVDAVTRPGAMISGKVTFSDGNQAEWYLDQYGRLGVAPKTQGYKPPQEDIAKFQAELQNELAKMGF